MGKYIDPSLGTNPEVVPFKLEIRRRGSFNPEIEALNESRNNQVQFSPSKTRSRTTPSVTFT